MALTSADVNNQSFSIDRKGYNVDEVDVFLERVAVELDDLNSQIDQLNEQLASSKGAAGAPAAGGEGASKRELDKRDARIKELEAQVADHRAEDSAIAQALIIAQRSADEIVANANEAADNTRQDAEDEAQRILDKANAEKQRVLDEIKKLEDDREETRGKYSDMLNDFISSSQDILNDLGTKAPVKKLTRGSHGAAKAPISQISPAVATYTTPTVNPVVVAPSTPKPSKVEKDFSGFGDTDDGFEMDDID
jgi:DivIVA domain-containing protein